MTKEINVLTRETIRMVKTSALARKYKCSDVYVRYVLTGARAARTVLARMILEDANDIVAVYERNNNRADNSKR